jgi:hypothetical protein
LTEALLNSPVQADYLPPERIYNNYLPWDHRIPEFLVISAGANLVFGGLHRLAWNSEFPSQTERLLWRCCSIISTVLPAGLLAVRIHSNILQRFGDAPGVCFAGFLLELYSPCLPRKGSSKGHILHPANLTTISYMIIYATSRIIILVLLFTTL